MSEVRKLLPAIIVGVMGNTCIYLIPLLIGAMVADRGFTDQQAGLIASADLAGYAVMTFFTAMFLIHRDWRRLAFAGVAIMCVANLANTALDSAWPFAAVRFLSGMGAGILAAIATVALGQSEKPDRAYGFLFAACLLFGTAGLWGLPVLLERFGLNGAYVLIAALAIVAGFVSSGLQHGTGQQAQSVGAGAPRHAWLLVGLVLVSITIFWAQQNAVYAYAERIGNASGLTAQFIGFALGLANLTGFVGASLVAWLGTRFGRTVPLVLATIVQLGCFYAFAGTVSSTAYLLAIAVLALAWNVMNPIQLGILASVDHEGRALALASTVIGVGLALGPALGALVLTGTSYTPLLWLVACLAVVSVVLLFPALRPSRSPQPATA